MSAISIMIAVILFFNLHGHVALWDELILRDFWRVLNMICFLHELLILRANVSKEAFIEDKHSQITAFTTPCIFISSSHFLNAVLDIVILCITHHCSDDREITAQVLLVCSY